MRMTSNTEDHSSISMTNKSWMSSLPPELHKIPLSRLAIPGSHNSGAFALDAGSDLAPDCSKTLKQLMMFPGAAMAAKSTMHRWSHCQKLNFTQQLHAGIRFFDLRVSTCPGSEDLFLVHTCYGPKVTDLTKALSAFLQEHPREIVLLDFNHFYAMDLEHHMQLVTLLTSSFDTKICPRCDVQKVTLENLWDKGYQIIIFYHNVEAAETFEEVWQKHQIKSLWAETNDTASCLSFMSKHILEPPPVPFLVCQGCLTPETGNLMRSVFSAGPKNLEDFHKPFLPQFCSWIRQHSQIPRLTIVTTDFVERDNFIQTVIDLNKQRISAS